MNILKFRSWVPLSSGFLVGAIIGLLLFWERDSVRGDGADHSADSSRSFRPEERGQRRLHDSDGENARAPERLRPLEDFLPGVPISEEVMGLGEAAHEEFVRQVQVQWAVENEAFMNRLMYDEMRSDPDNGVHVYYAVADRDQAKVARDELWRICIRHFGPDQAEFMFNQIIGKWEGRDRLQGPFGGFGEHDVFIEFIGGEGMRELRVWVPSSRGGFLPQLRSEETASGHGSGVVRFERDAYETISSPDVRWLIGDGFDLSREGFGRLLPGDE